MFDPKQTASTSYIALGSNLRDRENHLRSAIAALRQFGRIEAVSSFYETDPVGDIPQSNFLNAVVALTTALHPEELLKALLRIEQQQGRDRNTSPPKGPRTLDMDLLSYGDEMIKTTTLTLPHPELAQRLFVLVPLAEIAPHWTHPGSGKTAAQLLAELSRADELLGQKVRRIDTPEQSA